MNKPVGERFGLTNQVALNHQGVVSKPMGFNDQTGIGNRASLFNSPLRFKKPIRGPLGLSHKLTGDHGISKLRDLSALRHKRASQLIEGKVQFNLCPLLIYMQIMNCI